MRSYGGHPARDEMFIENVRRQRILFFSGAADMDRHFSDDSTRAAEKQKEKFRWLVSINIQLLTELSQGFFAEG